MCDLTQPKPTSGPTLCEGAQELVVTRMIVGDRNSEVRALLKKHGHWSDISDNTLTRYRQLPVVKEARTTAIVSMRDVGVVALARRIDKLEMVISRLFDRLLKSRPSLEPADHANLTRAVVIACREMSRLVDTIDPDGIDGIPNAGEVNAPVVSIEQILAAARVLRDRYVADQAAKAAAEAEAPEANAQ